jgi:hypothetical protein
LCSEISAEVGAAARFGLHLAGPSSWRLLVRRQAKNPGVTVAE